MTTINYEFLVDEGTKIDATLDGTCLLYEYNGVEYVVLADNTVITREQDNRQDAIFPYPEY